MSLNIVGISAFYHDSACCLLKDGEVIAAAEEERFTRIKHDSSFPVNAFKYCLEAGDISIKDVDCIVYYEDPVKKLARQIWSGYDYFGTQYREQMNPNRPDNAIRNDLGYQGEIMYLNHHLSHAASTYFYSGFEEAAILTVDGVGEWATTTYGVGKGNRVEIFEEVDFPNSVGLVYSAFTSYLGFRVNSGEYKVMGLAPYGEPKYASIIRKMFDFQDNGQYQVDMRYFDFTSEKNMYTQQFIDLFGQPPRAPESKLDGFYMDVARSLQVVLEEIILKLADYLYQKTHCKNLCLAGGVALNCVANGVLLKKGPFDNIFVQPAANDAGSVLGAAAEAYSRITQRRKRVHKLRNVFLGPSYTNREIKDMLDSASITYEDYMENDEGLFQRTAELLAEGKVVGWYQGRMEFGPRALGARSILADPRREDMRDKINQMVKKRESFRPFAPSVLEEEYKDHFDLKTESPYMLFTCQVHSPIDMPAITHVDNSARIQTVNYSENPRYANLIKAFFTLSGCPVLLNTSFNVRGEPIVQSPLDALLCFINTSIDCLVIQNFIIYRHNNNFTLIKILNKGIRRSRNTIDGIRYTFI